MSDLQKLLKQKQELDQRIAATRAAEKDAVIADIKEKISLLGLTAADLGLQARAGRPAGKTTTRTVAPQFRDPVSGATWSGRGKPPKWIAGRDRTEFAL